ncbi:hypothetical protein Mapa_012916 [Marchantia paleacea]|nr:hypothetical protein Mapa_012916 [Marchantia paleacea]
MSRTCRNTYGIKCWFHSDVITAFHIFKWPNDARFPRLRPPCPSCPPFLNFTRHSCACHLSSPNRLNVTRPADFCTFRPFTA